MTDVRGLHDFDFLFGSWSIRNRRLRAPLTGADDWHAFDSTSWCRPLLGGAANVDEFVAPAAGFTGMTVRTVDAETALWSIYWASTTALGTLQPPVAGRFERGVGIFTGADDYRGTQVAVRYTWSEITDDSARWHQDYSPNEGASWETNWVMELTRTAAYMSS